MSGIFNSSTYDALGGLEERLKRVEQKLSTLNNVLSGFFTIGRLRTDRVAPNSSTDVLTLDALHDIVRDTNYTYVLINDSNNLRWRRITMSSF